MVTKTIVNAEKVGLEFKYKLAGKSIGRDPLDDLMSLVYVKEQDKFVPLRVPMMFEVKDMLKELEDHIFDSFMTKDVINTMIEMIIKEINLRVLNEVFQEEVDRLDSQISEIYLNSYENKEDIERLEILTNKHSKDIENKVDKEEGHHLMSEEEREKLSKVGPNNEAEFVSFDRDETTAIKVGGIEVGTSLKDKNIGWILDEMFYPELFGNLVNPSVSFTTNISGFREVGERINGITFTTSFSKGRINPQYQSLSADRVGEVVRMNFTGEGLSDVEGTMTVNSQSVDDYTVRVGTQSWSVEVFYEAGVQPIGSKGTPFNNPAPAGSIRVNRNITGVYAIYGTFSDINQMTRHTLVNHNSNIEIEFAEEDGDNKQSIIIPSVWRMARGIEQLNTLSGNYDPISMNTFTITEYVDDKTSYRKYTHNGATIGKRRLKFIF